MQDREIACFSLSTKRSFIEGIVAAQTTRGTIFDFGGAGGGMSTTVAGEAVGEAAFCAARGVWSPRANALSRTSARLRHRARSPLTRSSPKVDLAALFAKLEIGLMRLRSSVVSSFLGFELGQGVDQAEGFAGD
jgi:hypothetical protein